uniref:Uncharacterized protein n=1 Tax=Anopheles farauti TaxID=69004 RepID=A0A182QR98_9DIPT
MCDETGLARLPVRDLLSIASRITSLPAACTGGSRSTGCVEFGLVDGSVRWCADSTATLDGLAVLAALLLLLLNSLLLMAEADLGRGIVVGSIVRITVAADGVVVIGRTPHENGLALGLAADRSRPSSSISCRWVQMTKSGLEFLYTSLELVCNHCQAPSFF